MVDILNDKAFLNELKAVANQARANIDAYSGGFDLTPASIKARQSKFSNATITPEMIEDFGRTYFPHYIRLDKKGDTVPLSVFQASLLRNFANVLNDIDSMSECLVAPRGEAKSTWCFIMAMFCICLNRKRFILYIMDALHQAAPVIESMKVELESNIRIKSDFPKCFGTTGLWRAGEFITNNGIKIQAFGGGTKLRGLKNGAFRPDMAILDDIENDENVRSPKYRDDLQHWINAAVMGLGEAGEKFDVLYPGTILHPDSVLVRTMKNPAWNTTICKSIITQPLHIDLWEKWEEIFLADGKADARQFYNQNEELMNAGAVVSWASKRPLLSLMELKIKIGTGAFLAEQQGEPQPKDAIFTQFTYWAQKKNWTYFGVVDPSLGKSGKGRDPSAILIGGICNEDGEFTLEVIEAIIKKRVPSKIIDDVIELQKKYNCVKWGIETVQFQEFLRTELIKKAHAQGVPINALPIGQSTDKMMRIESLESPIKDGLIRFHSSHTVLLEQLSQFPEAPHDDGPDALEMLYNLAVRKKAAPFKSRFGMNRNAFSGVFGKENFKI